MQTKLITLSISLAKSDLTQLEPMQTLRSDELRSRIETQLTQHGSPLRWAVTAVDKETQRAHVEAVVTTL